MAPCRRQLGVYFRAGVVLVVGALDVYTLGRILFFANILDDRAFGFEHPAAADYCDLCQAHY